MKLCCICPSPVPFHLPHMGQAAIKSWDRLSRACWSSDTACATICTTWAILWWYPWVSLPSFMDLMQSQLWDTPSQELRRHYLRRVYKTTWSGSLIVVCLSLCFYLFVITSPLWFNSGPTTRSLTHFVDTWKSDVGESLYHRNCQI